MRLGREYWKLWTASTVSSLGDGIHLAALPLLATTLTRDPAAIAGVAVAGGLPWLLFGLVGGAVADRVDRRALMVQVDLFRAVVVGALAAAVLLDHASTPLLYAAAFLLGTAETLFDAAAPAILPAIVERDRLERANAPLYIGGRIGNEFVGPALGGILFAAAAAGPFLLDAASFAVAAGFLLAMRGSFRPEHGTEAGTLMREVAEGLRWVWRDRVIRAISIGVAVLALVDSAWFSILVLYAFEILDLGSAGFGALIVAGGVGSVLGGLAAATLGTKIGSGPALIGAVLLAAVTQLVVGLTSSVAVAVTMLALSGLAFAVWNILVLSMWQRLVPDPLLGRVTSTYRFLGLGGTAAGAAAGGLLAAGFGLRAPFLVGAPILLVTAVMLVPPLRSLRF
jgi:MFS family permease